MKFTIEKLSSMPMFWRNLTPFESAFIRQRQIGYVSEGDREPSEGWDLISETAFMLASGLFDDGVAFDRAIKKIARLDGDSNSVIAESKKHLVYELRDAIRSSVSSLNQDTNQWMPEVPGFAALGGSEADLLCGEVIVEFKCVARNFHPKDVRQVLLYAAILAESGVDVSSFAILNPRMACSIRSALQEASLQMSGRAWVDVRLEIANSIESYSRILIPSGFDFPH